jgi:hypothetical protein
MKTAENDGHKDAIPPLAQFPLTRRHKKLPIGGIRLQKENCQLTIAAATLQC